MKNNVKREQNREENMISGCENMLEMISIYRQMVTAGTDLNSFSSFGLPARAGKRELERGLRAHSISAMPEKNTGWCDLTLERQNRRSSVEPRESCSLVDSEELEPEALVESGVAHQKDNSVVKMGLEEAHRASFSGNNNNNRLTFIANYANSFIFRDSTSHSISEDEENRVADSKDGVKQVENTTQLVSKHVLDSCSGRYIYVHDLPSTFNTEILKNCSSLIKWFDICKYISNMGLGPRAADFRGIFQNNISWFETNQFLLEVIFHNRMNNYKCLTNNSSLASIIYVPFYAGLDIGRYLWGFNTSIRDSAPIELAKWVSEKPEWKSMGGRDHFFVAGRVTWDFRRQTDNDSDWGNKLMSLPEFKNMTILIIESYSQAETSRDFAIPYPTYFHPSSDDEVFQWQNKLRKIKRQYLFSFAGAPRPNNEHSIRSQIINQCLDSGKKCKFLNCALGENKCDNPTCVIDIFQRSKFCLQPSGDSSTRRSTFDSILAGCIPVFFDSRSAYEQYIWHLPKNYSKYSVFIPEDEIKGGKVNIGETLSRISEEEVAEMREEIVKLIPRIIYANPMSRLETLEDAFDIAIEGVLDRVEKIRKEMEGGKSTEF
ncbi:hypothetical protein HYC85_013065 [Camellia sinensis]|uniref:Exostosin GT47 domain-containing protein n=1 Tax=Camellia sinensis TaxID=4442 RepID=A0A7J7HDT2_CAMSI|nr:hypothetical protein HYC85_013065 [Camellia sinensis]